MPTREVRIPGPGFDKILREIAERLSRDDWERRSTPGGEIAYYIVGFEAHRVDVSGALDFDSEFPLPSEASALTQWYTTAQVAGQQRDHLGDARIALVRLGVPAESVDAFAAGRTEELQKWHLSRPEHLDALNNLLEAILIARKAAADDLNADERLRLSSERAKAYLREVAKKYAGILGRVGQLDPVEFADPQLEEASRCYLYGFNRAAVVCAAASVETHLKRRTGKTRFDTYSELTDTAFWAGILDGPHRDAASTVFKTRRRVVHDVLNPSIDEAGTTLVLARGVVGALSKTSGDEV